MRGDFFKKFSALCLSVAMVATGLPGDFVHFQRNIEEVEAATGSGKTEDDPMIVTTYQELEEAMNDTQQGIQYIKLGDNIEYATAGKEREKAEKIISSAWGMSISCNIWTTYYMDIQSKKVLDLNGKYIYLIDGYNEKEHDGYDGYRYKDEETASLFKISDGGDLTVNDSVGGGSVEFTASELDIRDELKVASARNIFQCEGNSNLTINGGEFYAGEVYNQYSYYTRIIYYENGNFYYDPWYKLCKKDYTGVSEYTVNGNVINSTGGNITINGGKFEAHSGFTVDDDLRSVLYLDAVNSINVVINDGIFENYGHGDTIVIKNSEDNSVDLTVNGGYFDVLKTHPYRVENMFCIGGDTVPYVKESIYGTTYIPSEYIDFDKYYVTCNDDAYTDPDVYDQEEVDTTNRLRVLPKKDRYADIRFLGDEYKGSWVEPNAESGCRLYQGRLHSKIAFDIGDEYVESVTGNRTTVFQWDLCLKSSYNELTGDYDKKKTFYYSGSNEFDLECISDAWLWEDDSVGGWEAGEQYVIQCTAYDYLCGTNTYEIVWHQNPEGEVAEFTLMPYTISDAEISMEVDENNKLVTSLVEGYKRDDVLEVTDVVICEEGSDDFVDADSVTLEEGKTYTARVSLGTTMDLYEIERPGGSGFNTTTNTLTYKTSKKYDNDTDEITFIVCKNALVGYLYTGTVYTTTIKNQVIGLPSGTSHFQWQMLVDGEWVDYGSEFTKWPQYAEALGMPDSTLCGKTVRLVATVDGYIGTLISNSTEIIRGASSEIPEWPQLTATESDGQWTVDITNYQSNQEYIYFESYQDPTQIDSYWTDSSHQINGESFEAKEGIRYYVYTRIAETEEYNASSAIRSGNVYTGDYVPSTGITINESVVYLEVGDFYTFSSGFIPENPTDRTSEALSNVSWYTAGYNDDTLRCVNGYTISEWTESQKGQSMQVYANKVGTLYVCAEYYKNNTTVFLDKCKVIITDGTKYLLESVEPNVGTVRLRAGDTYTPTGFTVRPEEAADYAKSVVKYKIQSVTGADESAFILNEDTGEMTVAEGTEAGAKCTVTLYYPEEDAYKYYESDTPLYRYMEYIVEDDADNVTLKQHEISMIIDDTYNLEVLNSSSGKDVTFTSSNTKVATIDANGVIKAVGVGEATITATCGTATDQAVVTVYNNEHVWKITSYDDTTHTKVCDKCGEEVTEEHNLVTIEKKATYTSEGYIRTYCTECGYYNETILPKLDHTHTYVTGYDKNNHWQMCSDPNCPDADKGKKDVEAHTFVQQEDGSKVCSVCGYREVGTTSVTYRTQVQTEGWQSWVSNGTTSGTVGKSLRLEGINIKIENSLGIEGSISYRTHVQTQGWQEYVSDGALSGTVGKALRLEAIQIKLTGDIANYFNVYYRVQAEKFGWLGWAKDDEKAGTSGYAYRLEAIQVLVLPKTDSLPDKVGGVANTDKNAYYGTSNTAKISYKTQVQTTGWEKNYVTNGKTSGTVGKAKRLEGIKIKVSDNKGYEGGITYRTHVQKQGWQSWVSNDALSGTVGKALRLEAIQIKFTGELAEHFDIYYRVQAQKFGWMGWAKNGAQAGTAGYGYRLEAIQIKVLEKGAPSSIVGSTANAFRKK